jgi:hypothetical protein
VTDVTTGLPTMTCPTCGDTVPVGTFCGACGAHLTGHVHGAPHTYRHHAYAAGNGEHVLRLSVVSSLFPHLPHRSRTPFRVALVVVAAALVVLAVLRWQAAMVGVAAVGFPLLFQLYLQEADVYHDLPVPKLAIAAVLGAVLGWAWAFLTSAPVARLLTTGLVAGVDVHEVGIVALLVPVVGLLLMLAPVAVLRLLRGGDPVEALDGFLFGAIGALAFIVAGTFTRLWPQLRTGLVAHGRPISDLVVEALLNGAAVPLTAGAVGAMVGAALWVRRRDPVHPGRQFSSPVVAFAAAAVLYVLLGLVDVWQPGQAALLVLHGVGAAVALLLLRIALHAVLLHEEHEVTIGAPYICPHCEHVVPQMPFCPHCGTAHRAASRTRRLAHQLPPVEPVPEVSS